MGKKGNFLEIKGTLKGREQDPLGSSREPTDMRKEPDLLLLSGNTIPWGSRSALERTQGDMGNVLLPKPSPPGPRRESRRSRMGISTKAGENYGKLCLLSNSSLPLLNLRDLSAVHYSQGTSWIC